MLVAYLYVWPPTGRPSITAYCGYNLCSSVVCSSVVSTDVTVTVPVDAADVMTIERVLAAAVTKVVTMVAVNRL